MKRIELLFFTVQSLILLGLSFMTLYRWGYHVWDLGFFSHAAYSIGQDQFQQHNPFSKEPFWKDHFALILYPIGWLIRKLPTAATLLALQAEAVALGNTFILGIFRKKNHHSYFVWSVFFLLLLYPWTYWQTLFDFHTDVFALLFLSMALYWKENDKWYYLLLGLTLLSKDDAAVAVLCLGVILWIKKDKKKSLYTLFLGIIWLLFTQFVIQTTYTGGSHIVQMYGYLGTTTGGVILHFFTRPGLWLQRLWQHSLYAYDVVAPMGFISILSPYGLVTFLIGVVGMDGLSQSGGYYVFYQYLLLFLPLLFYGYAEGVRKIKWNKWKIIFMGVWGGYWSVVWLGILPSYLFTIPTNTAKQLQIYAKEIPSSADVLTFNQRGMGYHTYEHEDLILPGEKITLTGKRQYALFAPYQPKEDMTVGQQSAILSYLLKQPHITVHHQNGVWLIQFQNRHLHFPLALHATKTKLTTNEMRYSLPKGTYLFQFKVQKAGKIALQIGKQKYTYFLVPGENETKFTVFQNPSNRYGPFGAQILYPSFWKSNVSFTTSTPIQDPHIQAIKNKLN